MNIAGARRGHSAFTLVELLVVIGIIAVLIALLMPVLSRVRESSRRLTDLSSLRQLAQASILYACDYDGYLPHGARDGHSDDDYVWISYKSCWLPLHAYLVGTMPLSCTSLAESPPSGISYGKPVMSDPGTNTVVGWIYWGGRKNIPATGLSRYVSPQKISMHYSPSSTTLWTCAAWDSAGNPWNSRAPHVGSSWIDYPPSALMKPPPDGLGVAKLDGSASFVQWSKLARAHQVDDLFYSP